MNSADMRVKATDMLAKATAEVMTGVIEPDDWKEAPEEIASLMDSARRKEAEEVEALKAIWDEVRRLADESIERSDEVRRELWKHFIAGAVAGGGIVYLVMQGGLIG